MPTRSAGMERAAPRIDDAQLGMPSCFECYDYAAHALWQWHAPELWRRFTVGLQRRLAQSAGLTLTAFRKRCRISYSKVVEFQARGVIHIHAPIRLDGPGGPDGPDGPGCDLALTAEDLEEAVRTAAAQVRLVVTVQDGASCALAWGQQVDCRTITGEAAREGGSTAGGASVVAHPEQVAAYLAKYLTKANDDFGLPARVTSTTHARAAGASPHAVRIITAASRLAREGGDYELLRRHLATLGYRGHPITKSRSYSVTFTQLRQVRRAYRRNPGLAPDADVRELLDDDDLPDGLVRVATWHYVGRGHLDLDQAAKAVMSAGLNRMRREAATRERPPQPCGLSTTSVPSFVRLAVRGGAKRRP